MPTGQPGVQGPRSVTSRRWNWPVPIANSWREAHALASLGPPRRSKFISSSKYTHGYARKDLLVTIAAVF